jgi:uncharacterized SAM-binding protein YcdF (DUF218 family)
MGGYLRGLAKVLGFLVAAVVVYVGVTAVQVYAASRRDQVREAQAIVVLGAAQYNGRPSPDLAARLDHALALWQRRMASLVVLTGGRQPGDRFTEAGVGATYLEAHGMPAGEVVAEDRGSDSWQSLALAATALHSRRVDSVLLVSDPFHDARIADMASQLGLRPLVSPTHTSPITGVHTVPYFAKETLEVAVGRVVGFGRLSHLTLGHVRGPLAGG